MWARASATTRQALREAAVRVVQGEYSAFYEVPADLVRALCALLADEREAVEIDLDGEAS
jgi:hypothetical protein